MELGHSIISTMEHGYQGRYIEGYELAKRYNIKFLFGTEAYWVKERKSTDFTNAHIFIGAKNEHGRQCINDILSEANISGFYRRPRVDIPLILSLPKDDVWVTTACVAYWKYDDIDEITRQFGEHFGPNFYLEVQYHNTQKQKELNRHILQLRDSLKIPLIMGCDSHFITPHQAQDRDDFLDARGMHYDDEVGWFMDYPDDQTAHDRFIQQGVLSESLIDEAMSNTNTFLDVAEYDCPIFNKDIKLPTLYPDWSQEQRDKEYERLVWNGWEQYKPSVPEDKQELYRAEIQDEINTVEECKMTDYFIMNHHIIRKGIENGGLLTKSGRGSGVSFITNMLLGFTDVDRIAAKVKMYPARFMSAERILQSGSLPDIDFNVADQTPFALAQQQILGEDHAYPMIAYGTLKTSAAWKLYAKSQGIPFEMANEVSGQIKKYEEELKQADEDEKEDINPLDYIDKQYHSVFNKSADYRGIVNSWSIAPCSYLLYQGSIRKEIGLIKIKDHLCCLMDGHWAEDGHFLKNDLLTVKVVELIYKVYDRIGIQTPTVNELLAMCPPEDAAWSMYAKRCCMGLNQVERTGTAARVAVYRPTNISELCAFVAAIRPGFKSMYKTFESRKPFSYGVKAFDDLLRTEEMPQSFCIYQEQEMAALNYAGIPMSECYTAIKNIAKKRAEKVLAYKEKFQEGFIRAMVEEEHKSPAVAARIAANLWQIIEDSSRYSFNASHSYCVSLDSLYCAWAKAHHPIEFYETLLSIYDDKGDKDKWQEAKQEAVRVFGIKFPPLRFGQDNRQVSGDLEKKQITSSIASIKGFGAKVGCLLYECAQQEYSTFTDILYFLYDNSVKSQVDTLIRIDYFEQYGNQRELFAVLDFFHMFRDGAAKTMNRGRVDGTAIEPIVRKHATWLTKAGKEAKTYSLQDVHGILLELEAMALAAGYRDTDIIVKAKNYAEIMGGSPYVSGKEEDRNKLYIKDVFPLKRKRDGVLFGYSIITQSIGSGKESRMTVFRRRYDQNPLKEGDIVVCTLWERDGPYFRLLDYEHLY